MFYNFTLKEQNIGPKSLSINTKSASPFLQNNINSDLQSTCLHLLQQYTYLL